MGPCWSSASQSSAGTRHITSNSIPLGSFAYRDLDTRWSLAPTSAPRPASARRISASSASVPTSQARWYSPAWGAVPAGIGGPPMPNSPRSWSFAEPGARRKAAWPAISVRTSNPSAVV